MKILKMAKQKDFKYNILKEWMMKKRIGWLGLILYLFFIVLFFGLFSFASKISIPNLNNGNIGMLIIAFLLWVIFVAYIILNSKKGKHHVW